MATTTVTQEGNNLVIDVDGDQVYTDLLSKITVYNEAGSVGISTSNNDLFSDYDETTVAGETFENTDDVVAAIQALLDNSLGAEDYKEWTGKVVQIGTDAPTTQGIYKNNLGVKINWSYNGVGNFTGTFSSALPLTYVDLQIAPVFISSGVVPGSYTIEGTTSAIVLRTYDSEGNPANSILAQMISFKLKFI